MSIFLDFHFAKAHNQRIRTRWGTS